MAPRYTPRFVTQFDGSGFASQNCTMAAGAMLLDKQTRGRIRTSGADLRARQSDQFGGTSLGALAAAFRTYREDLEQVTLPTVYALRSTLNAGAGAVLQGYYGSLPSKWRLQANARIDHALYIDHATQTAAGWWYWVMDPIGKGSYQGAYVPESAIRAFGWTVGGQGWVGSAALSSRSTAGQDQAQASGATQFQVQLLVWVQATRRDPAKTLTRADLLAYLEWFGRKQSPRATDAEIAAFVSESWNAVSGWVGKAPAYLSSAENNPRWPDNADPIALLARAVGELAPGIGEGIATAARQGATLLVVVALLLVGLYLLVRA